VADLTEVLHGMSFLLQWVCLQERASSEGMYTLQTKYKRELVYLQNHTLPRAVIVQPEARAAAPDRGLVRDDQSIGHWHPLSNLTIQKNVKT
jgi:hypothetical protein